MNTSRQALKLEFLRKAGMSEYELVPIPGDASFRTYDRIKAGGESFIVMNSPPDHYDTAPFIEIAQLLRKHSLPAPEIYHIDAENGFLILEDFGSISIKEYLAQNQSGQREVYARIVELLAKVQKIPAHNLPRHSIEDMLKGIEVFTDWYVLFKTGKVMDARAKEDFLTEWREVLADLPEVKVLGLRDFHTENMLLTAEGIIGLLDFQDATQSHPAYDLVSLLEDARCDVSKDIAQDMTEYYLSLHPEINRADFLNAYAILGAQRNSRILGVFARKAMRDGARQYLEFIPRVIRYLEANEMKHLLKGYI